MTSNASIIAKTLILITINFIIIGKYHIYRVIFVIWQQMIVIVFFVYVCDKLISIIIELMSKGRKIV
jgi:hypothetical protein